MHKLWPHCSRGPKYLSIWIVILERSNSTPTYRKKNPIYRSQRVFVKLLLIQQARKLQATLVWNYYWLTRWRGWSVELLAQLKIGFVSQIQNAGNVMFCFVSLKKLCKFSGWCWETPTNARFRWPAWDQWNFFSGKVENSGQEGKPVM